MERRRQIILATSARPDSAQPSALQIKVTLALPPRGDGPIRSAGLGILSRSPPRRFLGFSSSLGASACEMPTPHLMGAPTLLTAEDEDEIDHFYNAYGRAFATCDLEALEALCEYPILVADAEGGRQITAPSFFRSLFERFRDSTWATTRVDRISKLAMGGDGAVLIIEFARLREDGTELGAAELPFHRGCSYFLRRRDDGWKLVGLTEHLTLTPVRRAARAGAAVGRRRRPTVFRAASRGCSPSNGARPCIHGFTPDLALGRPRREAERSQPNGRPRSTSADMNTGESSIFMSRAQYSLHASWGAAMPHLGVVALEVDPITNWLERTSIEISDLGGFRQAARSGTLDLARTFSAT